MLRLRCVACREWYAADLDLGACPDCRHGIGGVGAPPVHGLNVTGAPPWGSSASPGAAEPLGRDAQRLGLRARSA